MKSFPSPLLAAGGIALVFAFGCGGAQPKHVHGGGPMSVVCPMPVAGTSVAASPVEGGAALTFTTTTDVGELRQRVREMAERYNHHGQRVPQPRPAGEETAAHGPLPGSVANAVDVERGAQLTLVPRDPRDLTALREHAHQHADKINRGDCGPME